ncbi:hypothetical protein GCM10022393_01930 [Aquimarina addita]|uniref:Uncharacterized protein n=1 Tax=Aquimarina addita TaxID=870485 RepID=A0ABP7XAJ4_9FLAO
MQLAFEKDRVTVNFVSEIGIRENEYTIKVYAKSAISAYDKTLIYTSDKMNIRPDKNGYFLDIDYWYYTRVAKHITTGNYLPSCIDFYFSICVGEEENEIPNPYKVHFIRYLPELLAVSGYKQAKKLHSTWFCLPPEEDPDDITPQMEVLHFEKLLEISNSFRELYQENLDRVIVQISKSGANTIKKSLKDKVQKAIKNNDLKTEEFSLQPTFGTLETKIMNTEYGCIPVFDSYHFHEQPVLDDITLCIDDDIDGLLLKNCMLRVIAFGKVAPTGTNTKIQIEQLGFYLKDQYGFYEDKKEDIISYCEIIDKEKVIFSNKPVIREESFLITSTNYYNYRKDHDMGGDFNWYSSIHLEEVSIEVIV